MKKRLNIVLAVATLFSTFALVLAQSGLSSWPFFAEIGVAKTAGIYELNVPLPVLDKARDDLADLRIFDSANHEIPYAVRVKREISDSREIPGDLFNIAGAGTSSEATVDLGENHGEHNEVEIQTIGNNFRRRASIEGSNSGVDWRNLNSDGVIFSFVANDHGVESSRISYPTSRYRYLRVRVLADELTDRTAPSIKGVKVSMAVREKGELTTWNVTVPSYQLLRNQGAPASSWSIDLGGLAPCDRLALDVEDESFSRPFNLEAVDDPQNPRLIATGELVRRVGEARKPLVITFSKEERVRKMRLIITDYSNQTLSLTAIQASAPVRQLLFELRQSPALPLRLFFGNNKIPAPHYDFEKEASARLSTEANKASLGAVTNNPSFEPEPLPLTERVPWLIYLVLAASSLSLAFILFSLARTTIRRDQKTVNEPQGGNVAH